MKQRWIEAQHKRGFGGGQPAWPPKPAEGPCIPPCSLFRCLLWTFLVHFRAFETVWAYLAICRAETKLNFYIFDWGLQSLDRTVRRTVFYRYRSKTRINTAVRRISVPYRITVHRGGTALYIEHTCSVSMPLCTFWMALR
jgi:hypothetical protein